MRKILLVVAVLALASFAPALRGQVRAPLFEENFTSDNSPTGQTAPTQSQLASRGWKDGITSVGTGYKFLLDPTLKKQVMYAHWTNASSERTEPDGTASGWKKFFPASRDVTLYAVVKFHNVANSPNGAHWHRFFNWPGAGDFSPGNADGQIDLDVSGRDKYSTHYDPNTHQTFPDPQSWRGFLLYSGGSLSYSNPGKNDTYTDDIWYELVWYVKAQTSGTSPTTASNGAMRVYLRPIGTTAWANVFDGNNFAVSKRTDPISMWMIGPYMDRWTSDIRHYYSRAVVWSGDAYTDGTLAAFLGNAPTPDPTPTPVNCVVSDWSAWSAWAAITSTTESRTRTRTVVTQPANGGAACPALSETETRAIQTPTPTPTPVNCVQSAWSITSQNSATVTISRTVTTTPKNGGKACGVSRIAIPIPPLGIGG